jgi:hypothetical protein
MMRNADSKNRQQLPREFKFMKYMLIIATELVCELLYYTLSKFMQNHKLTSMMIVFWYEQLNTDRDIEGV